VSKGVNFAKDYQKDSYNKNILMGKIKRIKLIIHILKTFIPQNMWNLKFLKSSWNFPKLIQNFRALTILYQI
jgi:hypothetical protein